MQDADHDLCLPAAAFIKEGEELARVVVAHRAIGVAHQLQKTGKILQDAIAYGVAEAAAHLGQVVQLKGKAGKVLRQNAAGHAGDIHIELFAVGQAGLFVHIQQIIHHIRDASQHNGTAAADDEEQHQRQHQIQFDVDGGSHLHRADHLQIIRADVQV